MLRVYRYNGVLWRFEDVEAPEGAVLVEVADKPVTAETPRKAPAKRAARARKPKTEE